MQSSAAAYFLALQYTVIVVGRNKRKLSSLQQKYEHLQGTFVPLSLNYNDEQDFIEAIKKINRE
ncbi:hypothetical protein [Alteribacillus sp. HJP-4]|uniref:hypothetical protein n=1 Tax=Alteribacillus sp. HJP-4 TaxID=2775394 RepID=UPI0035CD0AD8